MKHGVHSTIRDKYVPFEEVDPLVSLEDHKPCGCEPEKGCGACEILQTHTLTDWEAGHFMDTGGLTVGRQVGYQKHHGNYSNAQSLVCFKPQPPQFAVTGIKYKAQKIPNRVTVFDTARQTHYVPVTLPHRCWSSVDLLFLSLCSLTFTLSDCSSSQICMILESQQ